MTADPLLLLRRQVGRLIALYATVLGCWVWGLHALAADHWLLRVSLATLAAGTVWGFIWPRLAQNHPPAAPALIWPTLGAANLLTVARTGLLAMLASLIPPLTPGSLLYWGPIILWSGAVALDGLDGHVARHRDRVSRLGTALDLEADGLGVLMAAGAGVFSLALPTWFLTVTCLRPAFAWGIWWRQRRGQPVAAWPESATRRHIAGLQMAGLGLALWPGVPGELVQVVAVGLTVLLLCSFARDWGCITSIPAVLALQARLRRGRIRNLRQVWLPASLRPLAGLSVLTALAEQIDLQQSPAVWAVSGLLLGSALLLLGGWWVRTTGLLLMLGTGLLATLLPYVPSMGLAVTVGMGLFLVGKGTGVIRHLSAQTGGRR